MGAAKPSRKEENPNLVSFSAPLLVFRKKKHAVAAYCAWQCGWAKHQSHPIVAMNPMSVQTILQILLVSLYVFFRPFWCVNLESQRKVAMCGRKRPGVAIATKGFFLCDGIATLRLSVYEVVAIEKRQFQLTTKAK